MNEFTYINGDKVEYTGNTEDLHGATAYEVVFVEGHREGETAVTYRGPANIHALVADIFVNA